MGAYNGSYLVNTGREVSGSVRSVANECVARKHTVPTEFGDGVIAGWTTSRRIYDVAGLTNYGIKPAVWDENGILIAAGTAYTDSSGNIAARHKYKTWDGPTLTAGSTYYIGYIYKNNNTYLIKGQDLSAANGYYGTNNYTTPTNLNLASNSDPYAEPVMNLWYTPSMLLGGDFYSNNVVIQVQIAPTLQVNEASGTRMKASQSGSVYHILAYLPSTRVLANGWFKGVIWDSSFNVISNGVSLAYSGGTILGPQWFKVDFDPQPTLTAGQTYWIGGVANNNVYIEANYTPYDADNMTATTLAYRDYANNYATPQSLTGAGVMYRTTHPLFIASYLRAWPEDYLKIETIGIQDIDVFNGADTGNLAACGGLLIWTSIKSIEGIEP